MDGDPMLLLDGAKGGNMATEDLDNIEWFRHTECALL